MEVDGAKEVEGLPCYGAHRMEAEDFEKVLPDRKETAGFPCYGTGRSRGAPAARRRGGGGGGGGGIPDEDGGGARRRRAMNRPPHNHSKIATDLFKAWFYENLADPFPSDDLKNAFADRTGLSYTQVRGVRHALTGRR